MDAEGHQLGQHAHAPGDSFEGRMKAGTDAVAPARRARPPPGIYADTASELETDDDYEEEKEEEEEEEEAWVSPALKKRGGPGHAGSSRFKGVTWDKSSRKSRRQNKGKHMGAHTTVEAAVRAYIKYLEDGSVPRRTERGGWGASQFKGVHWDNNSQKWRADCKGTRLGYHATEEDAVRAISKYLEDGIDPVKHRDATTSQFTGVCWDKARSKWTADCKGKRLTRHATEEAAAQAYNVEAERRGLPLNVISPAGAAGASASAGAGAGPGAGGGANSKRAASKTPAAPATSKKPKRAAPTTLADPAASKKMKL